MSDLRFDPLSGLWVVIANNRNERPVEFLPVEQLRKRLICPFCGGNEQATPQAIALYDSQGNQFSEDQDEPAWSTRVVANKYSSFQESDSTAADVSANTDAAIDGDVSPGCSRDNSNPLGPYRASGLLGHQELIIPTPNHLASLSELGLAESKVMWQAVGDRVGAFASMRGIAHAMVFMNCRSEAGASLEHIHLQVIGSPLLSGYLCRRTERAREYFNQHQKTLVSSIVRWELEQGLRVIEHAEHFSVFCPYASRFPFQVWVVPHNRQISIQDLTDEMRLELARLTKTVVAKLDGELDKPSYNMMLQVAPFAEAENDHWYLEIFPRTTRFAGYELGTDIWINQIPPELAARRLR